MPAAQHRDWRLGWSEQADVLACRRGARHRPGMVLGGAAIGYLYVTLLNKGSDIGKWIISTLDFFKSFFVKQAKMTVSSNKKSRTSKSSRKTTVSNKKPSSVNQDEIDAILDKISQSGYESLSTEEKQKLFNASKK